MMIKESIHVIITPLPLLLILTMITFTMQKTQFAINLTAYYLLVNRWLNTIFILEFFIHAHEKKLKRKYKGITLHMSSHTNIFKSCSK